MSASTLRGQNCLPNSCQTPYIIVGADKCTLIYLICVHAQINYSVVAFWEIVILVAKSNLLHKLVLTFHSSLNKIYLCYSTLYCCYMLINLSFFFVWQHHFFSVIFYGNNIKYRQPAYQKIKIVVLPPELIILH